MDFLAFSELLMPIEIDHSSYFSSSDDAFSNFTIRLSSIYSAKLNMYVEDLSKNRTCKINSQLTSSSCKSCLGGMSAVSSIQNEIIENTGSFYRLPFSYRNKKIYPLGT